MWSTDVAEQIKSDKAESVVMNGVKIRKVGKLDNYQVDEELRSQSEEKLCKAIIRGLARRNREKHAISAEMEEEEQDVRCFDDDIMGKELQWHAVRKVRAQELKYLRDLGVCQKIDENEAVAKYGNRSSGHEMG